MFLYRILETERGPVAQILYGANVIDECGPWENLTACIEWADSYIIAKNGGMQEPDIS